MRRSPANPSSERGVTEKLARRAALAAAVGVFAVTLTACGKTISGEAAAGLDSRSTSVTATTPSPTSPPETPVTTSSFPEEAPRPPATTAQSSSNPPRSELVVREGYKLCDSQRVLDAVSKALSTGPSELAPCTPSDLLEDAFALPEYGDGKVITSGDYRDPATGGVLSFIALGDPNDGQTIYQTIKDYSPNSNDQTSTNIVEGVEVSSHLMPSISAGVARFDTTDLYDAVTVYFHYTVNEVGGIGSDPASGVMEVMPRVLEALLAPDSSGLVQR